MTGFLLDTNVLSELIKPRPEPKVTRWLESVDQALLYLSVMTLGEVRKGVAALQSGSRRVALEAWLETRLRPRFSGRILPIDEGVADRWGMLAAAAAGRDAPLPVIDGLLAATALQFNLTLVTRDTSGLAATGVAVFNPWVG